MNTLKMMMGGGADVAQLAEMIRRFGRGKDKILAHITPEEAVMLKKQGGRGTINPMTGLPEFQEEEYYNRNYSTAPGSFGEFLEQENIRPANEMNYTPVPQPSPTIEYRDQPYVTYGDVATRGLAEPSYLPPDAEYEMALAEQRAGEPVPVGGRQVTPEEENIFGRAERGLQELRGTLDRYPTLTRIGGAGANLVAQALLARRANRCQGGRGCPSA